MLSLEQESEIDRGLPLPFGLPRPVHVRAAQNAGEDSNLHWNRVVTTSFSFSLRSSRTPAAVNGRGINGRSPEEVTEYRITHPLVGDVHAVGLLAGELHGLLELLHPVQQFVDPPRGQGSENFTVVQYPIGTSS